MASWMVHLRIADQLLDQIPALSPTEFIVGNIAPDSGVPNEDWTIFTPSTKVSHFKTGQHSKAGPETFAQKYFQPEMLSAYTERQYSFYLGYFVHLMTDVAWSEKIVRPAKKAFANELAADPDHFIWKMKEDWYDLDFRYLRDHPNFRAFQIYQGAIGFPNVYMDEFSAEAFDNRRQYITEFYTQDKDNLDRIYPYLTQKQMDAFVAQCAESIVHFLQDKYCVK